MASFPASMTIKPIPPVDTPIRASVPRIIPLEASQVTPFLRRIFPAVSRPFLRPPRRTDLATKRADLLVTCLANFL